MKDFEFGNYMCSLRKKHGLSQKRLAARLGVSDKAVSKWENGRSKPSNKTLLELAKLFGISSDEILTGGKRKEFTLNRDAFSPAALVYSSQISMNARKTDMNFIPKESKLCYDYLCTWTLQGVTATKVGIHSNDAGDDHRDVPDVLTDYRDALTDELLFGSECYYHPYDRTYRAGLYLLLDDGWDVPFGSNAKLETGRSFGACSPNREKFPNYGETPVERLKTLKRKAQDFGYAGIGLWIATETGGSGKGDLGIGEEARRYWAERARWCEEAGVSYWKIDWGKHCDPEYRKMLTEVLRENAPHIIIEHAVCQPPYSDMGNIGNRVKETEKDLPLSDVFRLYDVVPPFKDSSMLMRVDEALSASIGMKPQYGTKGILNAETCSSICAALGCAIGIMDENSTDSSDEACLRWHRLAPPFSVYDADYKKSDLRLTDSFFFDRKPSWFLNVAGKHLKETAPAVMARGCELPEVKAVGDVLPFVIASKNPYTGAYSIATVKRTINPNSEIIGVADITFRVGSLDAPIGIFGYYNSLTLVFDEPIGDARVYVQDMMAETATDVTEKCGIDGTSVIFDGDDMRVFGTSARSDEDKAEPSFLVKVVKR